MDKTHWKKVVSDPNYLGEADFQEGQEMIVTINKIAQHESIKTAEGKSDKAVAYFKEGCKPLILNVTNSKTISKIADSPYFEDWPGTQIQLFIQHGIKAFGEVVNAVRVRPFKPRVSAPKLINCVECGSVIGAFGKMTAEQMAKYTNEKYGKPLCSECAKKAADAVKEDEGTEINEEGANEIN